MWPFSPISWILTSAFVIGFFIYFGTALISYFKGFISFLSVWSVCVCVCRTRVCACVWDWMTPVFEQAQHTTHMWMSEDNCIGLVLSFHTCCGDWSQGARLVRESFTRWPVLPASVPLFYLSFFYFMVPVFLPGYRVKISSLRDTLFCLLNNVTPSKGTVESLWPSALYHVALAI